MTLWDQLTDAERDTLVAALFTALPHAGIPEHLHAGLIRYLAHGFLPGSFLQAVLCNDLTQTIVRADPLALPSLEALVTFLLDHAPPQAWGSRAAVEAWTTTPDRLEIT